MLFLRIISRAVRPKPRHKKLFEKSFLELQKLRQNKAMCSVRSFCGFSRGFFQKASWSKVWNAVPRYSDKRKTRISPRFLYSIICCGFRPKPRHKGLFAKSPLESQKLHQNKVMCSGEVFADFQGAFFKKPLEAKFGTQFQHILIKEKRGFLHVFCIALYVVAIRPNPDARNFSRKVS